MKLGLKEKFIALWEEYFNHVELPLVFFYSDDLGGAEKAVKPQGRSCLICELAKVRKGKSLAFSEETVSCGGGQRYLGFTDKMRPGFEHFLSCGNDKIEGERYIRTPEMVTEFLKNQQFIDHKEKNIVFKRWDKLSENDEPEVVIFFATADVLSGLFTLANFDQTEPNGTYSPFCSGCGAIVHYPYLESKSERQRAVLGMFDPSARPCVPPDVLSFAVPMQRFENMISFMEESFLITETWTNVKKRIK